jgi:hypothetical protein
MAWTTPRTWVFAELVTESHLNAHIRDNLNILKVSIDDTGKVRALSSSYLADLSGANQTGLTESQIADGSILARVAGTETITGVWTYRAKQIIDGANGGRLVLPVGTDLWAVA